jgi:hypothetical protein
MDGVMGSDALHYTLLGAFGEQQQFEEEIPS